MKIKRLKGFRLVLNTRLRRDAGILLPVLYRYQYRVLNVDQNYRIKYWYWTFQNLIKY